MAAPLKLDRAKHAALERVARMKRKSPVDVFDMELFFGRPLRCKAVINHLRRARKYMYGESSMVEEAPTDEEEPTDDEESDEEYWEAPTIQEMLAFKSRKTSVGGDLNLPHEILEAILSHLPTLSLIVATGVNMTFRKIVQNSPTLQRNLFFRPTNKPREFVKLKPGHEVAVATQKEYDDGFEYDSSKTADDEDDGNGYDSDIPSGARVVFAYEVVALCPLLVPDFDNVEVISPSTDKYEGPRVVCLSRLTPLAEHWANMYLTNPPCMQVDVRLNYTGSYARQYNVSARVNLYCGTGITIASLLDATHEEGLVKVTRKS